MSIRWYTFALRCSLILACCLALVSEGTAGLNIGNNNRNVGGISINAKGVVEQTTTIESASITRDRLKALADSPVPARMKDGVELRMISLRGLEAAIADAVKNNAGNIPDDVRFLAGLQRIQYVLVYPKDNDIVLAGPGEGWKVNEKGSVVGITTNRPVLRLDDLVVAMRSVNAARDEGISCSIDPTQEGRQQFAAFMRRQRTFTPGVVKGIEKALGPQQITLTGVAPTTHFAHVLVAADIRMKRLAMHIDQAPVTNLPSFLDLYRQSNGRLTNMMPRWWLACNYEPLGRGEDGLVWELRGDGVKAMTEDDFIEQDGTVRGSGKKNPIAQKWSENFNKKYAELSTKDSIFGELRNCMDMCVVAALIKKHDLTGRAGCPLPVLSRDDSMFIQATLAAPKTVSTQSSLMKRGREWIITASGGVQVESWLAVQKVAPATDMKPLHTRARGAKDHAWWWN